MGGVWPRWWKKLAFLVVTLIHPSFLSFALRRNSNGGLGSQRLSRNFFFLIQIEDVIRLETNKTRLMAITAIPETTPYIAT